MHYKSIPFTKESIVLMRLTQSLCNGLYPWERDYKVIEVCSYTIKDTRMQIHETVTALRVGNEVKHSIANCGMKRIAVLNECYSFHKLASYETTNNPTMNQSLKQLCHILDLHSVTSHNCSTEHDRTWPRPPNSSYMILVERYVKDNSISLCSKYQYLCADHHCISDEHVNDGVSDCPDGSDEKESPLYCHKKSNNYNHLCQLKEESLCMCESNMFLCEGGPCISYSQVCDGKVHCTDASDELNCPLNKSNFTSIDSTFICKDGAEIPYNLVDDFLPDCLQAEDEMHLDKHSRSSISCQDAYHIPCVPGHPRCFPFHGLCVYDLDHQGNVKYCRNGAHLAQCTYVGCPYKFKCPQSYCIHITRLCDKVNDCPYGEDEDMCDYTRPLVCTGMFYCRGGSCVHQVQVCDGERNCPKGDDESNCGRKIHQRNCKAERDVLRCKHSYQYSYIDLFKYRALILIGNVQTLGHLYNVSDLVMLNISNTGFNQLNSYQFIEYSMLHILDMSFNNITILPENTFANLHSLSRIVLIGNRLSKISAMIFTGLTAVKYLDLSNIELTHIELESFNVMTKLTTVNLSGNLLTMLDVSMYNGQTLQSVDVRYNPLKYLYPPLVGVDYTLISNIPDMCCFPDLFLCCGSSHEMTSCVELPTESVNIGLIVYGLLIICMNCVKGIMMYLKISRMRLRKYVTTLSVLVIDCAIGLYLLMVGWSKYVIPAGLILNPWDGRHITCLFGAWLQQFMSLFIIALTAKHAYDYAKDVTSGQLASRNKGVWQLVGFLIVTAMSSIGLTALVVLLPLPIETILTDVYPLCSILLVNNSKGHNLELASLAILLTNILLSIMTIAFICRLWIIIKSSRKAVEGFGSVVKTSNVSSQHGPGIRIVVRSLATIIANVFGMCIYLLVGPITMNEVAVSISLTLVFHGPSFISPLIYIITIVAANIK